MFASRRDVYLTLVKLAGTNGYAEVSFTNLVQHSRRSRPLIVQAVADLVAAGLVISYPPVKNPQRQKSSRYELV